MTIGHDTHLVPDPFLVMATQNPIESEGTYPLPEAQVDRFMLKVVVGYPSRDEELTVVQRSLVDPADRAPGARDRVAEGAAARRRSTSTSTPRSSPTRSRSPRRRAIPAAVGLGEIAGLDRVRRQPAWPDRARPERARARAHPRPRLRARHRRPLAREGRAASPPRAHLPRARRAADAPTTCSTPCSRRVAAPPLELGRPVAA